MRARVTQIPISHEHLAELVAEHDVGVDATCIWRCVQAYAPELNKRCRSHLKPTNKIYRIDGEANFATARYRITEGPQRQVSPNVRFPHQRDHIGYRVGDSEVMWVVQSNYR